MGVEDVLPNNLGFWYVNKAKEKKNLPKKCREKVKQPSVDVLLGGMQQFPHKYTDRSGVQYL